MKIRIIYVIAILFAFAYNIDAQSDVTFKTICKRQVSVGEQFQVSYELNGEGKDFRSPNFNNFEIIGGPFSSTSSSIQVLNGSVTRTNTQTYSFHLRAIKEGKFTLPQASITVDKKRITSEPAEINVVASHQNTEGQSATTPKESKTTIGNKDIFLEAVPSKRKVYLGEQIVLTYRIFFIPSISQLSISESPSYTGFWTKDIKDNNGSLQQSSIIRDGQQYNVATIQEIVLFPQKTGELTIDPLGISCLAQIRQERNRPRGYDPFEDFFGDVLGTTYTNVKKDIKSQPIKIEVEPLPGNKPANFNGAVGQFTFTSKIDKTELSTNEAFTFTVTVSGKGNIELLDLPKPTFPPDFEVFDPKITTNIKDNALGISGSKKAEYIVIPRVSGEFEINEMDFSYFDTSTGKYVTLKAGGYNMTVTKNEGSHNESNTYVPGQADIKYLGSDIRHISVNNKLNITGTTFFMSPLYIIIIAIMTIIFTAALFIHNRISRLNKNQVMMRNKKATKVAKKRLSNAYNHFKANNQNGFYEELSQALWGYISDKLNISRSQLSMDSVREVMKDNDITEDIIGEFIELLNSCEFARFAPGDPSKKMDELYNKGIDIITKIERTLK